MVQKISYWGASWFILLIMDYQNNEIKDNDRNWAVAHTGKKKNYAKIWWGKPGGQNHLEDITIDGRIILKYIFRWGTVGFRRTLHYRVSSIPLVYKLYEKTYHTCPLAYSELHTEETAHTKDPHTFLKGWPTHTIIYFTIVVSWGSWDWKIGQVVVRSTDVEDEMMITRKQLMQDSHTYLAPPPSFGDTSYNSRTPNKVCGSMVIICTHYKRPLNKNNNVIK